MRLSGQFQACFFFYENILRVKKAPKRKINSVSPLRSFSARKIVAFVVFCLLNFFLLVGFGLSFVFVRLKFFRKKINKLEIVVITSCTILMTCSPINPRIENLFSYFLTFLIAQY